MVGSNAEGDGMADSRRDGTAADSRAADRWRDSLVATPRRDSLVRQDVLGGIAERRIGLAYQPVLDLRHGGVWGFEALVRLTRPDGSIATAGEFLPVLQAEGLLPAIGHAVLDRLSQELPLISAITGAKVTFNLSAQEAADTTLIDRLVSGDLTPFADRLVVEVTEAVIATSAVAFALDQLQERGLAVAIDDFGTGHAGAAALERVMPDVLKVDGAFTREADRSDEAEKIVRSAVDLGTHLGCLVVAEGVETPKQQAMLPDLGVSLGQGYVLGRPVAPTRRGDARPENERAWTR